MPQPTNTELAARYKKLPVDQFTITELTDALGVEVSAALLGTSKRAVYTVRNTNVLGIERHKLLIDAVRSKEAECRERLLFMLQRRERREASRAAKAARADDKQ